MLPLTPTPTARSTASRKTRSAFTRKPHESRSRRWTTSRTEAREAIMKCLYGTMISSGPRPSSSGSGAASWWTMMASAASLRIGRAAHFPWWSAELQRAAHAHASYSSAMQLTLIICQPKTIRVQWQGENPARAQSVTFTGPPSGAGVEASAQRRCQGSLKPPREVSVYEFLDF